jgi:hypothetical protein
MLIMLEVAEMISPDVVERAIATIREPDLRDFDVFMAGFFAHRDRVKPELRALELRCMPYQEYLKTDEWQHTRQVQMEDDDWRCRVCNSAKGLHVHHRTYQNRGNEQPGDLVTLCADCHHAFHRERELVK